MIQENPSDQRATKERPKSDQRANKERTKSDQRATKERPKSDQRATKMTATDKTPLTYEDIEKMCTEFINDTDTIIGQENYWTDLMITTIDLDYSKEEIMLALNVTTSEIPVEIPVKWTYRGEEDDMTIYVAIYDHKIDISTHARLL